MQLGVLLLGTLLLLIALGIPIAFCIELAGIVFLLVTDLKPLILVAQRTVAGMDNYTLLAIPLFTLAGYLMNSGGLSKRLVDWVEKFFGWVPGSMGTVTIICCTVFAALTGSGPATVAAIGAIMIPSMLKAGYPRSNAAGLLAAGGSLGPIIPPSIVMIMYGTTMSVSIPTMFLGGILPGLFIALCYIITNIIMSRREGIRPQRVKYSGKELLLSTWRALGVLFLPIIVLGGIYGGIFTPTEAATVCVVYSVILGLAYRELSLKSLTEALKKTVETSAMVVLIAGMSGILGWLLAATGIPAMIANAVLPYISNHVTYLIVLMIILFAVGCVMETLASMIILAPILVPIGLELGLDPLHLGICFCIYLVVGFITPPFGLNLFAAASSAEVPFTQVVKGIVPYLAAVVFAVIIISFVPQIVLLLPTLFS